MELVQVPVEGGDLAVAVWEGDGPLVVAAHGITASHLGWSMVADALGGSVRLVAPDLRGRGASSDLPGPYGLRAHARDLVAVMDHLGVESTLIVGQSMGGYVAAVMAEDFPERVARVLMVDGGLPLPIPEGLSLDQVVEAVIGPARARLSMTFESREAYRDFWRNHPALAE
jgi:pimeloyl-ACP methyl ester carboxylesterase